MTATHRRMDRWISLFGWGQGSPGAAIAALLVLLISGGVQAQSECVVDGFSETEATVLNAYIAYYGRPADPLGLTFWAGRLEDEGGDLRSIIDAFGVSPEFDQRFGSLDNEALVSNLFGQLFGREPDAGGLAFYVDSLEAGERNLQSIALDILFGAQNEDLTILGNRLDAAKHYVARLRELNIEDILVPAETLAGFIDSVLEDPSTAVDSCLAIDAYLASLDMVPEVVSGDTTFFSSLTVGPEQALLIDNDQDIDTTITIRGDFDCSGAINLADSNRSIRFDIGGDAGLSCEISSSTGGSGNQVTMVVGGFISTSSGFSPFPGNSFILVDDASLLMTPQEYADDAEFDDGVSPIIQQPLTNIEPQQGGKAVPRAAASVQALADCAGGSHTLSGSLAPMRDEQNLDQATHQGPVVLAVWTNCDVDVEDLTVDPPTWNPPEETPGEGEEPAEANGADGRNGLTANFRTNGRMNFRGVSTLNLMPGGAGQRANHVASGPGADSVATGGDGGKGGSLKMHAGGGFQFAEGAQLIVNPGAGGAGGSARARGGDGEPGCHAGDGGNATATGGKGGDNTKVLRIRGIDPTGLVSFGELTGGPGGAATAVAGKGGKGDDGDTCNGGDGGTALSFGGNGGNVAFSYSGPGSIDPDLKAGDGADATSTNTAGGDGGNNEPDLGGNGGNGNFAQAQAGEKGTGSTIAGAEDGTPRVLAGTGNGGNCGLCDGSGGIGGTWTELLADNVTDTGEFDNGSSDCECADTGGGTSSLFLVFGGVLICVDHTGNLVPNALSTLQWLMEWSAENEVNPNDIEVRMRIDGPDGVEFVTSTLGATDVFFQLGINSFGAYEYRIVDVTNTATNMGVEFSGGQGSTSVTNDETNKGQCAP